MGATPQAALAQITLPPLSPTLQERWMREIMSSAAEVFDAESAVIAGGHSTTGAELSIGFTLTGVPARNAVTLSGAQVGDAAILTRPIGTGVILAAEMEKRASGDVVQSVLTTMATPQGDAARVLAEAAHAMTDVTGFGLAGHLSRMADASGVSAHIRLLDVPVHDQAEALAASGVRSTIWASNRAAHAVDVPDSPKADLLFDPQTCGGLLAAVAASEADDLIEELRDLGHAASRIGDFQKRSAVSLTAV